MPFCNAKAKATAKGKAKVKAQAKAKAKAKAKANAKAKAKPKAKVKAQAKAKAKEARSAEKILLLQNWRAQRGEKFIFATGTLVPETRGVQRLIDITINGIAKKNVQTTFFGIFVQKPEPRADFFSLLLFVSRSAFY